MNNTQQRFKEIMTNMENTLDDSHITFKEGRTLLDLCYNLFMRYEEMINSRDNWRSKYLKLKEEVKKNE